MSNKRRIRWNKPTTWLVLAFIALAVFMFARESKAETSFELAPESLFVAGNHQDGSALFIVERLAGKYDFGIGISTAWTCEACRRGNSPNNQAVFAQRIVEYKRLELGIGISYWHNKTAAWDSHTPYALSLAWRINENWRFRLRHFSTGGSSDKNGGLDLLTIAHYF